LRVGLIGCGRAGSVIAAALARCGHEVAVVYAVSDASVERAHLLLPGASVVADASVATRDVDLVVLAVPDGVLPGLVKGLAATTGWPEGQFVVHLSGRFGIEVLEPASAMGALPFAIHPAMTLTGRIEDIDRLLGAPFAITTTEELRAVADTLVWEIGGDPVWVPEAARGLYHAALTHGANHLATVVNSSVDLLVSAGVGDAGDAARLLRPLLEAALENALRFGDRAMTGPVVRGDASTVSAHIDELRRVAPELAPAYIELARLTAIRAMSDGRLRVHDGAEVLKALGQDSS
jgi:predicted short-subunit dehydrogenase-like oxidoreductase (DUF2520 family)